MISKLIEELSEAATAVARCIAQGIEASEPVTGKPNKEWLEDELADVQAMLHLVISWFALDMERMTERTIAKYQHKLA